MHTFLVQAKQNTYASGTHGNTLEDGAIELVYREGKYRYRDRYYGEDPFCGQEIVFLDDVPVWIMNYYGHNLDKSIKISTFLKESLRLVSKEAPFRGPAQHKNDTWLYTNQWEGDSNCFNGYETIHYQGKKVYELWYHGGII